MNKTVADLNIGHFKELLEAETDPVRRQTIQPLLAEEEAKLVRCEKFSNRRFSPEAFEASLVCAVVREGPQPFALTSYVAQSTLLLSSVL